jgi:hypothetical protein
VTGKKKEASKEVGEEKRRRKRLYDVEREKLKRNINTTKSSETAEVVKGAVIAGPVQVGKMILILRRLLLQLLIQLSSISLPQSGS